MGIELGLGFDESACWADLKFGLALIMLDAARMSSGPTHAPSERYLSRPLT
jgi:hypothetical protein